MGWKSGVMWKNYTHLETDDLRDYLLETEAPAAGDLKPEEILEQALSTILELSKDPSQLRAFLEQVQKD